MRYRLLILWASPIALGAQAPSIARAAPIARSDAPWVAVFSDSELQIAVDTSRVEPAGANSYLLWLQTRWIVPRRGATRRTPSPFNRELIHTFLRCDSVAYKVARTVVSLDDGPPIDSVGHGVEAARRAEWRVSDPGSADAVAGAEACRLVLRRSNQRGSGGSSASLTPAQHGATEDVHRLLSNLYSAISNGDSTGVRSLLDDDLVWVVGASGSTITKSNPSPARFEIDGLRTRDYGVVVLADYVRRDHWPVGHSESVTSWRATAVIVRRDGASRIVRHTLSGLARPVQPIVADSAALQAFVGRPVEPVGDELPIVHRPAAVERYTEQDRRCHSF